MATKPIPQETKQELSAVFTAAAAVIERRGLACDVYEDAAGRLCAVGALSLVVTGTAVPPEELPEAIVVFARRLPDTNEDPVEVVAPWNDAPERTQTEVVAELRAAAAEARRREGRLAEQRHQFLDLDADLVARWAGLAVAA